MKHIEVHEEKGKEYLKNLWMANLSTIPFVIQHLTYML